MNFGEIKEHFKWVNNNLALKETAIPGYLNRGMARIQRDLKLPFMIQVSETIAGSDCTFIVKPTDFLKASTLIVNELPLQRVSLNRFFELRTQETAPEYWTDLREQILLCGIPPKGSRIWLIYYATLKRLVLDTDTNVLTEIMPDLLIYAALFEAACDMLAEDSIIALWKGRYDELAASIQRQADEEAYEGKMTVEAPRCEY